MGAMEAVNIMNELQNYRALTRRNVRQYVVGALIGGSIFIEGTTQYDTFSSLVSIAIYGDQRRANRGGNLRNEEQQIISETAKYLREVLSAASGERLSLGRLYSVNFSEDVHQEVKSLLGRKGLKYLGISEDSERLVLDPEHIARNLEFEGYIGEYLKSRKGKREAGPLDPMPEWNPPNPMLDVAEFGKNNISEQLGEWYLHWPELEPLPDFPQGYRRFSE